MISPDKNDGRYAAPQNSAFTTSLNVLKMGTGRGYAAALTDPRAEIHLNNQLEMSLESSFFDGSSFIEDGGGKAMVNMRDQNLEELLQADDVDPDAFLIKTSGGLH